MTMVGHKTESVYGRYAIVEELMLNEAGVRCDEGLEDRFRHPCRSSSARRGVAPTPGPAPGL